MTNKKPAPKKQKIGRPSLYTEALAAKICRRLAEGETLRAICRDTAMPDKATVLRWLADKKRADFRDQYGCQVPSLARGRFTTSCKTTPRGRTNSAGRRSICSVCIGRGPWVRFDVMGLVPFLAAAKVVALSEGQAVIESGAQFLFRRHTMAPDETVLGVGVGL